MGEIASGRKILGAAGIVRGPATWYCYLLLGFFVFMLTIQGNVVPFLKAEFGLSYGVAGLHASAIAVGGIIVGLFGDRVVRRFGRRRPLAVGTLGCAAGAVVLCLSPTVYGTIAGCALIGLGGTFIPTVAIAILADLHGERRSVAINESSAINYGLAVLAPLLMGLCLSLSLDWRVVVLIGAAMGTTVVIAFRGVVLAEAPRSPAVAGSALPAAYWCYWCAIGFALAIEYCALVWGPEFLARVVGLPEAGAAAAAGAFGVGMFAGRAVGSVLAQFIAASRLLVTGLAVTLVGFGIYWGAGQPALSIAGLFVLGLGVALLFPLTLGLAIGAAPSDSDAASTRSMLAFGIALLLTPTLLGSLADQVGLWSAHWLIPVLVVATFLAFAAGRIVERRPSRL